MRSVNKFYMHRHPHCRHFGSRHFAPRKSVSQAILALIMGSSNEFKRGKRGLDGEENARESGDYGIITIRCEDTQRAVSRECRVTRARLLLEGDRSFFAGYLRAHPTSTTCVIHIREDCHEQFCDYLSMLRVEGGHVLEIVGLMFGLEELARRLRFFKCLNCGIWINPVAPQQECVVRPLTIMRNCLVCGAGICDHYTRVPSHCRPGSASLAEE